MRERKQGKLKGKQFQEEDSARKKESSHAAEGPGFLGGAVDTKLICRQRPILPGTFARPCHSESPSIHPQSSQSLSATVNHNVPGPAIPARSGISGREKTVAEVVKHCTGSLFLIWKNRNACLERTPVLGDFSNDWREGGRTNNKQGCAVKQRRKEKKRGRLCPIEIQLI